MTPQHLVLTQSSLQKSNPLNVLTALSGSQALIFLSKPLFLPFSIIPAFPETMPASAGKPPAIAGKGLIATVILFSL